MRTGIDRRRRADRECDNITSRAILQQYNELYCSCESHGLIDCKRKATAAAIWPLEMCRRIVAAIIDLTNEESVFVGRPRKYPEYIEFDCPACQRNRPKTDGRHTRRNEPPELCRHPGEQTLEISCPACAAGEPADSERHTHDKGCRSPLSRIRGRRRKGGSVRDAAIPAAGDGSDRRVETQDYDYDIYPNPDAAPSGLQRVSPREEGEVGGALENYRTCSPGRGTCSRSTCTRRGSGSSRSRNKPRGAHSRTNC